MKNVDRITDALRGCPICGARASQPENIRPGKTPVWNIGCASSFCISMNRGTKTQVIADWNTRPAASDEVVGARTDVQKCEIVAELWNLAKSNNFDKFEHVAYGHLDCPAAQQSVSPVAVAEALPAFAKWFAANYPGPDTIIHDPLWHAPKILRAARAAFGVITDTPQSNPPALDKRLEEFKRSNRGFDCMSDTPQSKEAS